jgi:ubiquinone/menaquinone biosynthesis C-methylase UbiE
VGASSSRTAAYDREAATYDDLRFTSIGGKLSAALDDALVLESLAPVEGRFILDVPAGTGRSSLALARAGARVCALDLSWEMLQRVRRKVHAEGNLPVEFIHGDATRMAFPDGCFDGICCLRLFHLLRPSLRPAFVREFRRVLRPDGLLIAEFPRRFHAGGVPWLARIAKGRPKNCLSWQERSHLFEGFELVRVLGGYFPFMRLIAKVNGRAALRLSLAIAHSGLRVFTRQLFVVLRKMG